ncbi:MAG TPA: Asp-tRNA(Asn)/Glu-tRNA(Gln) amidotransferase subunit GatC [Clostridia bacterium]|jgi:aspartyl-tRNA(Asn)/glutamyl-tRNA(Gln) amidotransferase subunit C|nr:Asp-tRNA(Asn)/Glu-tRNA(Gln) amidotransferase subunit GatC [Clostridia bacterium]
MITEKDFENAAENALLYFNDEEKERFMKDMSSVIEFVSVVKTVNSDKPTAYKPLTISATELREDVIGTTLPNEEALSNADSSEDGYFVIKRRSKGE